jgi:hypothetical protein
MELKDGVGDPDTLEYFRLTADTAWQRLAVKRGPSSHLASTRAIEEGDVMHYFLITYDALGEELLRTDTYDDGDDAERAYAAAERDCRRADREGIQVVLFSADSLASVKETHPHYFRERGAGDTMGFAALARA